VHHRRCSHPKGNPLRLALDVPATNVLPVATRIGSAVAADSGVGVGSAQQHVRALAAELGLETGGENECDTDVEQQQQSKSKQQRNTTIMAAELESPAAKGR
jgi:hypothetical protein